MMRKKFIDLLLAVLMLAALLSVPAFAEDGAPLADTPLDGLGAEGAITLSAPEEVTVSQSFDVIISVDATSAGLLHIDVAYPEDALRLDSIVLLEGVPGSFSESDPYLWLLGSLSLADLTGQFAKLTFTALSAADEAEITVGASGGRSVLIDYFVNVSSDSASVMITESSDPVATGLLGDANGDGVVNAKDATLIAKYAAGIIEAGSVKRVDLTDCNNDGVVNAKDATLVAKYAAGMAVNYPVGSPIE